MNLYPLKFEPIYFPKVWGGRHIEQLGRTLPGDGRHAIGESWELADLDRTSPSGAGGQPVQSVVANGRLAGQTLQQLLQTFNSKLTGTMPLSNSDGFPLLIKYLDARKNLSLQVHPSSAYAAEHPEAHLKTEGWYVVDAEPDAVIYKGFKPGVDERRIREAILQNTIVDLLNRIQVQPGDFHFLPSGTCHALGRGILVAEIQTPSDTTFRLYDWGRTDRPLHIEQALACLEYQEVAEPPTPTASTSNPDTLFQCDDFALHQHQFTPDQKLHRPADQLAVWMVIRGAGQIHSTANDQPSVDFATGQTLLLPSCMDYHEATFTQSTTILQITSV